jgi:hypothetical protein
LAQSQGRAVSNNVKVSLLVLVLVLVLVKAFSGLDE